MDAPGDPHQRRAPAARVRLPGRRARGGSARVGPVGRRAARRARRHRRRGRRGDRRRAGPPARRRRPARRSSTALGALDLEGRRVVVTAGGTAEAIDPVRFIGNRSTGKMGVAIAEAAARPAGRGSRSSPGRLEVPVPPGDRRRRPPESTAAMRDAVVDAVFARPRRRPGHGRRRRRLPPDPRGRRPSSPATPGLHASSSSRPRTSSPRSAPGPATLDPAPGHRRVRGRDGLARAGPRQAPPQGRRPPRRQRRRRGRARASAPTPTGSSILGADGSRDDLPLLTKREVADRLLDRVARAVGRTRGPGRRLDR